jgi:hypothetical protein
MYIPYGNGIYFVTLQPSGQETNPRGLNYEELFA